MQQRENLERRTEACDVSKRLKVYPLVILPFRNRNDQRDHGDFAHNSDFTSCERWLSRLLVGPRIAQDLAPQSPSCLNTVCGEELGYAMLLGTRLE